MFNASFSLSFGRLKAGSGYVTKGCILSRRFDRRISKGSIALQFLKVSMHRGTKADFANVRRVRASSGRNDVRLGPDIYEGKNVPTW